MPRLAFFAVQSACMKGTAMLLQGLSRLHLYLLRSFSQDCGLTTVAGRG